MFVRVATNEGLWTPPTPPARPIKAEQTAWESVRPSRELHVFVFVEAFAINGLQEVALRHSLDTCTHYASESNSGLSALKWSFCLGSPHNVALKSSFRMEHLGNLLENILTLSRKASSLFASESSSGVEDPAILPRNRARVWIGLTFCIQIELLRGKSVHLA